MAAEAGKSLPSGCDDLFNGGNIALPTQTLPPTFGWEAAAGCV